MAKNAKEKIREVLGELRPSLKRHGGNVALKSWKGGAVTLRVQGACRGCPMSAITFRFGVDKILKDRVPEIKEIKYA